MVSVAKLVIAPGCGPGGRGFESHHPPQKIPSLRTWNFFIQAAVGVPRSELAELWGFPQAWYIIAARSAVHIIKGGIAALVYHHAPACIFLRLDDIQHFVLMICNSFGIDDIQGSRLDLFAIV